jgi:hypothetical protein
MRVKMTGLPGTLAEIVRKFPGHTSAHRAVTEFVSVVIVYPSFGRGFLEALVPMAVSALDAEEIERRAFGWSLLNSVKTVAKLQEPVLAKIAEIDGIVGKSYGGELRSVEIGGPGGRVGGGSHAQLMQLLYQIMNQK